MDGKADKDLPGESCSLKRRQKASQANAKRKNKAITCVLVTAGARWLTRKIDAFWPFLWAPVRPQREGQGGLI